MDCRLFNDGVWAHKSKGGRKMQQTSKRKKNIFLKKFKNINNQPSVCGIIVSSLLYCVLSRQVLEYSSGWISQKEASLLKRSKYFFILILLNSSFFLFNLLWLFTHCLCILGKVETDSCIFESSWACPSAYRFFQSLCQRRFKKYPQGKRKSHLHRRPVVLFKVHRY